MKVYREHRPTSFDSAGLGLPDRQGWLVAPVSRTRDSASLAESNFRVVLDDLGGETDNVEVHRFSHWGPGWYEIILIQPGTTEADKAAEWETALEDYPVASDEDFSNLEYERAGDYWQSMRVKDRMEVCERFRVSKFAARRDWPPDDEAGEIVSYLAE